ncbi:hypothetical protein BV22DRAFT_1041523, partial [Leucogyrophana mollusca]
TAVDLDVICARKQHKPTPQTTTEHTTEIGWVVWLFVGWIHLLPPKSPEKGVMRMSATLLTKNDQQKQVGERQ